MHNHERIPGAEAIWRQLPQGWQGCWLYFDTILNIQVRRVSDFWETPRYDGVLLICDDSNTFHIRLTMKNITGNLPLNRKLSGLDIEDASYTRGYETTVRYRIVDIEDPDVSIFCQDLFAELVSPLEPPKQT